MTHVIAVSTSIQRDLLVKQLVKSFKEKNADSPDVEIVQDKINRIKIYHKTENINILLKTILVVIVQVYVNVDPLHHIYDDKIQYDLSHVFRAIDKSVVVLNKIKNITSNRRDQHEALTQLARSLSSVPEEY